MTATRSWIVLLALAVAAPAPARAQSVEAETLFREGKRLMKSGQIARACDKLDAADRLEPTAGTEINLADCREKNGQLATAWAMFVKTAATAKRVGDTDREAEARRRADLLEPQLVYLTITVPEASNVPGLVIKRNGTVFDEALWDQRVPVDSDQYTIACEAPGYEPWSTTVAVKTKHKKVEVPVLQKRPGPPAAATPVAPEPARPAAVSPAAESSSLTGRRRIALVAGAAGVVLTGVATGFGIKANSSEAEADKLCPGSMCSDPVAVERNKTARRYGGYANIGFAVGGAAIIGAAVLWLTGAPRSREAVSVAPVLDAGQVGVTITRGF